MPQTNTKRMRESVASGLLDWQIELCKALGLNDERVARIVIDVDPEWSLPMVFVEIHPNPDAIKIVIEEFKNDRWEFKQAHRDEA